MTSSALHDCINVIDDCTRLLIASRATITCTTANSWDTLCRGAQQSGWPERLLSDNGKAIRGRGGGGLIPNLAAQGISDYHSRSYHPQSCGKVERFHQTLKLHLRSQEPVDELEDLQSQLDRFVEHYNHRRHHLAIGRRTPAVVWTVTPRSGPADRPLNATTNTYRSTVDSNGRIRVSNKVRISVDAAYAGQTTQLVITGRNAHVFIDGRLVRRLTIDPTNETNPSTTEADHPRKRA